MSMASEYPFVPFWYIAVRNALDELSMPLSAAGDVPPVTTMAVGSVYLIVVFAALRSSV